MAYLMTDAAAGGQAALQLQQTMAAAPDVQQAQANKMQEQQVKLQQEQATLEKTKLANLVADTGLQASKESKAKLQQLAGTPEFKAAEDSEKLRLSAAVQFQSGDIENGVKTLTAAELYDTRAVAIKQKQLDQNAQLVGNTFAVLDSLKTPEQQATFFKEMEVQKPEEYKALVGQIGTGTFEKMSSEERLAATKGLMLNAKGQMATQLKQIEAEKTKIIQESRERIERIRQDGAMARKLSGGGSDRDMRDWNIYNKAQEHIESSGKKVLEKLNQDVDKADVAKTETVHWYSPEPSAKTIAAYTKAVEARDEFKRGQVQKELNLAVSAPDFPGKSTIIDNLKRELELYPEPVTPIKIAEDKPETPKPAAKPTVATSNKPAAPKFEEGKVYTDAKGNKAKYVNGKWEPQ